MRVDGAIARESELEVEPVKLRLVRPARLTQDQAQEIKDALVAGATIRQVASRLGAPYQLVHRIAKGKAWARLLPPGPVVVAKDARGPKRKLSIKRWHWLWAARRAGKPVAMLSEKMELNVSSVRRLVAEFDLMIAHECSRLQLTSGSYEPMRRKYNIRNGEAQRLDESAQKRALPPRLKRILEEEFPKLEKFLSKEIDNA